MSGPGMGAPPRRSMDFKGSGKRLLGQFRPERARLVLMLAVLVVSVGLNVIGPKILGHATDLVFGGFIGQKLPDGLTKEQALEGLRRKGEDGAADMLSGMDFTPGHGIDFGAVGMVLLVVAVVYAAAGLLMLWAGRISTKVITRTVFRLRERVEEKLARLPLSYLDKQSRGEVLSRVTNDIDNLGQTLQQTLGQIVNSLLMIVGVLGVMF